MGEGALVLTTRPPRTTWFHSSARSICSAESPNRLDFGPAGCFMAAVRRTRAGACFARAALASFHSTQLQEIRCVVAPKNGAQRLHRAGRAVNRKMRPLTRDAPWSVFAVALIWPKRWQRFNWTGPLDATNVYTDTHRPQSSVRARNLDSSGPRVTDTMKWAWEEGPWPDPDLGGRTGAASLPGHECPEISAPPARRSQASSCRVF